MTIIEKIKDIFVGDPAKKTTDRYKARVSIINELEPSISKLTDNQLKEKQVSSNQNYAVVHH